MTRPLTPSELPSHPLPAAAPTEPRDVSARPLSPEEIEVGWLPPLSSGDRLSYRVHWRIEGASSSLRAFGPDPASGDRPDDAPPSRFRFLLKDLTADTEYQIWVRVARRHAVYSIHVF